MSRSGGPSRRESSWNVTRAAAKLLGHSGLFSEMNVLDNQRMRSNHRKWPDARAGMQPSGFPCTIEVNCFRMADALP